MAVNFPPYYTSQILNADGKPVAGGLIRAYLTGTETPAPLFAPDGTPLGSSVSIDAAGNAVFCLRVGTTYRLRCIDADGAVVWTRDGVRALGETAGIENPMTTAGDLIVGGVGGQPDRLGVGTDGDILATASGTPTWEGGPKKYRNVYGNIPSPQIDDGYLGCLFYLSGSAQALTLPATANIPPKAFIDFVFLDDTTTLTITPQGGSVLNTQATAVTIGGQAATLYRLTFLGRGDIGGVPTDQWAVGGSVLPDGKVIAATGDATRGTLNAKINPESPLTKEVETDIHGVKTLKLALEPGNDEDVLTTEEDGLGNKYALWKPPSGKLKVTSADKLADYLVSKLVPGTGITIATRTDLDGVQTLEISATGGGGGGGAPAIIEPFKIANCTGTANDAGCAVMQFAPYKFTPTALTYYVNAYTGSTRKIKGVVYNSSGKVVYSSAELPLVNKMNTIPLSKVTTYEDKEYFTPGELFFIGVAISSGDSSYQWWTMSSSWYKSFVMSYPPPDTKSSTNQNTIHWMSLTVTPLS